jgi:hypothetical protein
MHSDSGMRCFPPEFHTSSLIYWRGVKSKRRRPDLVAVATYTKVYKSALSVPKKHHISNLTVHQSIIASLLVSYHIVSFRPISYLPDPNFHAFIHTLPSLSISTPSYTTHTTYTRRPAAARPCSFRTSCTFQPAAARPCNFRMSCTFPPEPETATGRALVLVLVRRRYLGRVRHK